MSGPLVAPVESTHDLPVKPLHANAEVGLLRLDEQVDMVRHQAEAETSPLVVAHGRHQAVDVALVVLVVDEDSPPVDAARDDVMDRARLLESRSSRHAKQKAAARQIRPLTDTKPQKGSDPFLLAAFPGIRV